VDRLVGDPVRVAVRSVSHFEVVVSEMVECSEAKKSENAPSWGRFQSCPLGAARQNPAEPTTRQAQLCSAADHS